MTDITTREHLVRLRAMLTDMARPEAVEPRVDAAVGDEAWTNVAQGVRTALSELHTR